MRNLLNARNVIRAAALGLLPLTVTGLFAARLRVQAQGSAEVIEQPDEWVAFTADFIVTHPSSPATIGKYYRASDGSYRIDTGPAVDDVRVVSITNIPDGVQYTFSRGKWTKEPGPTSVELGRPIRWRRGPGWSNYSYKVALRKGESGSLTSSTGWFAYQYVGSQGVVKLKVPELNLFDVSTQRPDGRSEVYRNVDLVEPDPVLFRPPAGVEVLERVKALRHHAIPSPH